MEIANHYVVCLELGLPRWSNGKESLPANTGDGKKRRENPGKSHGLQWATVHGSPWGRKEHTHTCLELTVVQINYTSTKFFF